MNLFFNKYEAYVFDLDGCIYSGETLYPAAKELIQTLRGAGKQVLFLSNNSTHTSNDIRQKVIAMGLPAQDIPILVLTELVGRYLFNKYGVLHVQALGSESLEECLKQAGHKVIPFSCGNDCDVLVFGLDTTFSYDKLIDCSQWLLQGGKLIATNIDYYYPGDGGRRIPETGAFLEAVKAVSGVRKVESVGKPLPYSFEQAIKITGLRPEDCVMVGDNPYTDICGARSFGMFTIWISHGNKFPDDVEYKPDIIAYSLEEFLTLITL